MPIHRPKVISSTQGLGVGTVKQMEFIDNTTAIGTETWGDIAEPWAEGEIIIAKVGYVWKTKWVTGQSYVTTHMFDDRGELVGTYSDITKPVRRTADGFEFDDMYLDVWQARGKEPVLLDEDELQEAFEAGFVTRAEVNEATKQAEAVLQLIMG